MLVPVTSLPDGAPPDFFHAGPEDPGVYVLAGASHDDGSLPYWFISSLQKSEAAAPARGSTWTLISLTGKNAAPKVWHQHGEDATPIRLRAERLASARVPAFMGRGYICPECDEMTVISTEEP